MIILAAPVTNGWWIEGVIGLDLVEGDGITCAGRLVGGVASSDRLLQICKCHLLPNY
jgi:hypothetical protein